jgi:hypothetical protein
MTPITFLGKRYYMVHNGAVADEDPHCGGCVFEHEDSAKCPNNYVSTPHNGKCNESNHIYIKATKKALADWVAWKLGDFKE